MLSVIFAAQAASRSIHVDTNALTLLLGALSPVVASFLVKEHATPGVKFTVTSLLAAVSGAVGTVVTNGGNLLPSAFVVGIGLAWIAALANHYMLTETGAASALSRATGSSTGFGEDISKFEHLLSLAMHPSSEPAANLDVLDSVHHLHDRFDAIEESIKGIAPNLSPSVTHAPPAESVQTAPVGGAPLGA